MHATLTVVAGPDAGREFRLAGHDTFLAGRGPDCHYRPGYDDPYICPRHFLVEAHPPRCRVIDLHSRTGIKLNGGKVEAAELADGDEVRAGQTVFRFNLAGPKPVARPAPAAATAEATALPSGPPVIPGFELTKELGHGALGAVYVGRQGPGAHVAVRIIRPAAGVSLDDADRFRAEVRRLEGLRHPTLVQMLGGGVAGPRIYVVTELVPGPNTELLVQGRGPLAVRAAVLIVTRALEGLAHAHANGFVHGDVKPSNLLVGTYGKKRRAKLADFGLRTAFDAAGLGGPAMLGELGTPLGFLAPERLTHVREVTAAADQYAAAATLYYLLTGRPPHDLPDHPAKAIATILGEDPVPIRQRRPDVPEDLAAAIDQALALNPSARFADVAAFRRAVLDSAGGAEDTP
jgi:serine/threonine protein kinase